MKLGIVVTDETRCQQALKLAERAVSRGWEIRCFLTDTGVKLLKDPQFLKLIKDDHWMALCEMSLERCYHLDCDQVKDIVPEIIIGGQYQDAELVKNSDRVLVF